MTPYQIDRIKQKIARIKKELAFDKRRWGGYYDDSRGLRYLPPQFYIKIKDYRGAHRYFNWFHKNFSNDCAYSLFFFEWTFVLFKVSRLREAENKGLQAAWSHPRIFEYFLAPEQNDLETIDDGRWKIFSHQAKDNYCRFNAELMDFAKWLENVVTTSRYKEFISAINEIDRQLEVEPVGSKRSALVHKRSEMAVRL